MVEIRPFTLADSQAAAELHRLCFESDPWPSHGFEALLNSGAEGFVALAKGEITGLILYRAASDEAEILTFGVLPAMRRTGIGKALLLSSIQELEQKKIVRIALEVAHDNKDALALYQNTGFNIVGDRSGYYVGVDGPVDAFILVKSSEQPL